MASSTSFLPPATAGRLPVWRYVFAGLCASLDSIGLARFAFTPLIPELIHAHWFGTSVVVYLGSANLVGYVCGALLGRPLAARVPSRHVLRSMLLLITATFFACALPLSVLWYFAWRFLSGLAGGVVIVLVAGTILPHVAPARKGAASGAIFLGLGLGIAASGTIIPLLLKLGLAETWIGLGLLSLLLTAISWPSWPASLPANVAEAANAAGERKREQAVRFGWDVRMLYAQYGLMAAAAVPTMVFLVDFISRGLGQGTQIGSMFWAGYGLGAIAGPPLYGYLADRLGPGPAIYGVTAVMAAVMLGFYTVDDLAALGALTVIMGSFAPGMVPLALARIHQAIPHHTGRQNIAWTRASVISAVALAVAAYGFSALLNTMGGDHRILFLAAAALLGIVLLMGIAAGRRLNAS
jgi:predicted MFS family arabinose efflux permease